MSSERFDGTFLSSDIEPLGDVVAWFGRDGLLDRLKFRGSPNRVHWQVTSYPSSDCPHVIIRIACRTCQCRACVAPRPRGLLDGIVHRRCLARKKRYYALHAVIVA